MRVLIVDDSLGFLDAASHLLRLQGVEVAGVASSGEEALRLASELRPDVTLIDIDLGGDDGIAVARRLAGSEDQPGGDIILISTHTEDEFTEFIEASPAIGFIPKPAMSAEAIERLLERRSGDAQPGRGRVG